MPDSAITKVMGHIYMALEWMSASPPIRFNSPGLGQTLADYILLNTFTLRRPIMDILVPEFVAPFMHMHVGWSSLQAQGERHWNSFPLRCAVFHLYAPSSRRWWGTSSSWIERCLPFF